MTSRTSQLLVLTVCLIAACSVGCRAGQAARPGVFQQPGSALAQPSVGQFGQRVGNIAVNRLINAGITRAISGF